MYNELQNLIIKMKMLEDITEPVVDTVIEENTVHPLVQAMRELRETGIIESVDPHTIFNQVKEIHREFRDIEEGDLPDRIYWFDEYKTTQLPLSKINLDEYYVDEDLVEDYIEYIKYSPKTMPPIVYDPIAGSVIDGMHRANAYARLGYDTIPAYVGLTKSDSYGEREEVEETVGSPTTYEQEYDMFKSKGPRRITAMTNEALDSSYPYEVDYTKHRYYFTTEDGIKYKVYFQGKDLVEVAFSAILPGEEENFRPDKTDLTGTGNSRKVFGTVIEIVKDYTNKNKPNAIYFTAANDEPSRIKLYYALMSQVDKALPDYYADKTIDLGSSRAYMIRKKKKNSESLKRR
jgi:hypothetical protein